MGMQSICWEDEENNRLVEFQVAYEVLEGQVKIESVTPNTVTFVEPATGEVVRKIGVHTEKGRALLTRQYDYHVGIDRLHAQISNGLLQTA